MANETLARRYAQAVFQLATEQNAMDAVRADLHAVSGAIQRDPAIREFFLSPVVDRKQKEALLAASFEGKVHLVAMHTVLLLVRKRRESLLPELIAEYDKLEMQARGAEPLSLASAKQLAPNELADLVARLQSIYGKRFDVSQRVDPSLIGGVRILMGDRRVDGSVAGRLEELSRTLFAET